MPRSTPTRRDSMVFLAGRRAIDGPYLPSKGLIMCQGQMVGLVCSLCASGVGSGHTIIYLPLIRIPDRPSLVLILHAIPYLAARSPTTNPMGRCLPFGGTIALVAVEIPVTQHPPHRSVLEALPHTAPTSGRTPNDVSAQTHWTAFRSGMQTCKM